jgi:membrane-associated protease RseP (regulator of RpoE activity)
MPPGFAWPGRDARLGVRVDPPSDELAEQLDLPKGHGLVVREVVPESAAAKAGLKPHDILLEFNGKAVANRYDELVRMVADIKPDKAIEIVVMRKGKKETIKDVKLPEAKAAPGFPPGGFPAGAGQPPAGIPQPKFGFQPPMGIGGGASVITTMTRTQDRLTLRHQEGTLVITLTGVTTDGKPKIKEIHVQDGGRLEQYESVDKVPERYRDKVQNLVEMSEKGSVRIDIKSH